MSSRPPAPRPLPAKPQAYRPRTKSAAPATTGWRVLIEGLEVIASIGIHPHEREARQRILVDVTVDMSEAPTPRQDRLAETLDYEAVARMIESLAREGHVQLVETLAERIARAILADPRAARAKVRVTKPEALSNARGVGCEIDLGRT
jgi:dihydroneopterin aldolase